MSWSRARCSSSSGTRTELEPQDVVVVVQHTERDGVETLGEMRGQRGEDLRVPLVRPRSYTTMSFEHLSR
jgi:hypothetical protein